MRHLLFTCRSDGKLGSGIERSQQSPHLSGSFTSSGTWVSFLAKKKIGKKLLLMFLDNDF